MNRIRAILIVNLFLAGPAWTELAQGQPQESELITKVYEVKWRSAKDLASLLAGFVNTTVKGKRPTIVSNPFNTITVSAAPDQHAFIQELLRQHDTRPKRVLFEFYILGAARRGEGTKNGLPASIQEVVDDISSLTKYRQFEVLSSPVITVTEGGGSPRSLKIKGQFFLEIEGIRVVPELGRASVVVDRFHFGAADHRASHDLIMKMYAMNRGSAALSASSTASLATPFVAASGETLVIGTSQVSEPSELGDALIILVTPTVLE